MIGGDISTILPTGALDLDLSFPEIGPGEAIAQRVLRAWMQPRTNEDGTPVIEWAPGRGISLQRFVNADLSPTELNRLAMLLEGEARKEDGVRRIDVTCAYVGDALTITGRLFTTDGAFELQAALANAIPAILGVTAL